MDGNKDEAQKCINMGRDALEAGDRARALKFLNKALRLDPTLVIDDLLSSAGGGGASVADDAGDTSSTSADAPWNESDKAGEASSTSFSSATLRARGRSSVASPNGSAAAYTEEQMNIVKEIKKKKDYYEILGLERSCTVEDVRKAYRKLSLKVHPDKNKAPGADEAFKAVSKSFQCLSNEESRRRYDVSGSEDPAPVRRYHRGFNANGFYDADIDAEEIFRNFFGGMHQATTPFGTFHFRTGGMGGNGGHGMQGSSNLSIRTLVQILPILFLLLINFLPSSDPLYTFNRSYPYEHKVLTSKGVPFYVKSTKFEQEYPYQSSERIALETRIERDYVGLLSQNCRLELQQRQWGFQYQTPHCDMLQKFQEGETV